MRVRPRCTPTFNIAQPPAPKTISYEIGDGVVETLTIENGVVTKRRRTVRIDERTNFPVTTECPSTASIDAHELIAVCVH
jgi:hypothetical protein